MEKKKHILKSFKMITKVRENIKRQNSFITLFVKVVHIYTMFQCCIKHQRFI